MKKVHQFYFTLALLLSLAYSFGYSQNQKEGIIEYSWSSIYIDSSQKENTNWREWNRIWFKDSCVVYELRINMESKDHSLEQTVVKKSYPVWKYVYLDLRTMICQEYSSFKDTAMPYCNYFLKSGDPMGIWKFFLSKDVSDTMPGTNAMSDTSINNILFKRIKVLYKYYRETGNNWVYYINCNTKFNMFHLNKTLNEMFPGCKATRLDLLDRNGRVTSRTEYKVISDTLSPEEEKIFQKWHQNACKTKLPLLSYEEAKRTCVATYEHENPTITIIPNK